jgi:hypothetical protein
MPAQSALICGQAGDGLPSASGERVRSTGGGAGLASQGPRDLADELSSECVCVLVLLEADHGCSSFRVEQHERGRIAADPHGDALLGRLLVVGRELATALSAAVLEERLDAFVSATGHAEVSRVNSTGIP